MTYIPYKSMGPNVSEDSRLREEMTYLQNLHKENESKLKTKLIMGALVVLFIFQVVQEVQILKLKYFESKSHEQVSLLVDKVNEVEKTAMSALNAAEDSRSQLQEAQQAAEALRLAQEEKQQTDKELDAIGKIFMVLSWL